MIADITSHSGAASECNATNGRDSRSCSTGQENREWKAGSRKQEAQLKLPVNSCICKSDSTTCGENFLKGLRIDNSFTQQYYPSVMRQTLKKWTERLNRFYALNSSWPLRKPHKVPVSVISSWSKKKVKKCTVTWLQFNARKPRVELLHLENPSLSRTSLS